MLAQLAGYYSGWVVTQEAIIVALFGAGQQGAFYDPSDPDTLFQDRTGAAATTPAGANDPVGTMLDVSGNNHHITAPSDAARPLLRTDGVRWWLESDGIDDAFTQGEQTLGTESTHIVGVERFEAGAELWRILGGIGGVSAFSMRWSSGNQLDCSFNNFTIGSGRVVVNSITSAGPEVFSFRRSAVQNVARGDALVSRLFGSTTHDQTGATGTKYYFSRGSVDYTRCKFYGSIELFDTFIDDSLLGLSAQFFKQRMGL